MADISISGKIKDKDNKDHDIVIDLDKGKKNKEKDKPREQDKIKIKLDGTDYTGQIVKAKKKKKKKDKDDDKDDDITIEWISSEENNLGGCTGVADNFSMRIHCHDAGSDKEDPYIIIELTEKAREELKKAKDFGFPELPEGQIRVKITKKEQDKLNDYFNDPELPKKLH